MRTLVTDVVFHEAEMAIRRGISWMVVKKRVMNMIPRPMVFLGMAVWEAGIILCFTSAAQGVDGKELLWLLGVVHQIGWIFFLPLADWSTATVSLTEDRILYQGLFHKKEYTWDSMQQIGLIWCEGRGYSYLAYVLVPSDGICHTQYDVWDNHYTFKSRGLRKNIYIPNSEQAGQIIAHCYGELDFDLSQKTTK